MVRIKNAAYAAKKSKKKARDKIDIEVERLIIVS